MIGLVIDFVTVFLEQLLKFLIFDKVVFTSQKFLFKHVVLILDVAEAVQ